MGLLRGGESRDAVKASHFFLQWGETLFGLIFVRERGVGVGVPGPFPRETLPLL